ncbi:ACR/RND family transmembrane transporter [Stenotrophomonas ginsengisoli]|uniref:ACR/RND family transmembrane transporter n=1 Tax=Stenotrophomonas ginsengisoli TaxID=336566 RepID=A0A0R0D2Q4_9GAMM|nr:efflux RND transporter permease subunit [Stenotrophomonas ginsengisoli]KRG75606.1 ACR/RND family transmembrane transporter [Stenotrophomonas ginsengisoli]
MNFSAWAIRRPLPSLMLFFILCVAGLWCFQHLSIARFPDVSLPMTTVSVSQPGASPSQLEAEVTRKVEDAVATIPGIKRVMSSVDEGMSTTMLEFHMDTELSEALDDTRDAVSRIRMDLPQDIQEPVVSKVDIGGALQTWAVVADHLQPDELSWFVDRDVTRAMYGIAGVAQVKRVGGIERQVRVDLDPAALQAWGITAGMVSQQLARFQVEQAGGKVELDGGRQVIRTVGTLATAQELAGYSIALADGRSVRLSNLATITDGAADTEQLALLDGKPAVAFSVSRTRQASELEVADKVEAAVAKLKADNPGIDIRMVTDMVEETRTSYSSSMMMLYEGALLAVLVVWLFLRDWRATWIAAVALPLSIIPTFAVMYFFGFSLNILTLLALAAVVGILVDDAIVEIENIVRHLRMGKTPLEAAREAADEIGMAVVATSVTLAAVFIPVAFMPGVAGKFFREFGWTAATAVLFSLLVARLLTPMMAAYGLKPDNREHRQGKVMTWYLGWVDRALRHRARTLWIAFGLFVGSMALVPLIPATFIPFTDLGRSNLSIELAPGSSIEQTTAVAERARALLADIPELKQVYTTVGGVLDNGDPTASPVGEVRKALLTLDWGPGEERERDQKVLERLVRERVADLPGARLSFISNEPGEKMQLVLAGDDPQRLGIAAEALERDLRSLQGLGSIQSSAALLRPEIVVSPDPARAADLGVATADIAEAARIATSGDYTQRMAKLNLPERQIPIRVGLAQSALDNPALVGQLRVPARNGAVPLAAVADVQVGSGPSTISRYQRQRSVTLTAELNGRPLGEVMAQVNQLPSLQQLPDGVQFITAGDAEVFVEMFTGFALAMLAGIICIYMVLLLLLNHPLMPVTILAAVPLSAGGAFGALLLTGNMLSLPSLIGLLMLIGIATKNSILLVDYAVIAEDEHGLSQHDALIDACRKRAQPVIMTTLAMGAGMLPIVFGFSGDSSVRGPMAVAVIGGLITSTVLSLVVIPATYTVLHDLGDWIARRFGRGGRPQHGQQA